MFPGGHAFHPTTLCSHGLPKTDCRPTSDDARGTDGALISGFVLYLYCIKSRQPCFRILTAFCQEGHVWSTKETTLPEQTAESLEKQHKRRK